MFSLFSLSRLASCSFDRLLFCLNSGLLAELCLDGWMFDSVSLVVEEQEWTDADFSRNKGGIRDKCVKHGITEWWGLCGMRPVLQGKGLLSSCLSGLKAECPSSWCCCFQATQQCVVRMKGVRWWCNSYTTGSHHSPLLSCQVNIQRPFLHQNVCVCAGF